MRPESAGTPLWPLAIGTFAIGSGGGVVAGLLPSMAVDLDVGLAEVGLLVAVYSVVYAVAAPAVALFGHRIPRRRLMLCSLTAFGLASVAMALVDSYSAAVVARGLAAVAAGGFTPTATVLASQAVSPERRGRAVATVFGGLTTASVVAAPIGALLGPAVGFRAVYVGIGVTAVLAAVAIALLVARPTGLPTVQRDAPTGGLLTGVAVSGATTPVLGPDERRTDALRRPGGGTAAFGWVAVVLAVSMTETLAAFIVQTYAAPLLDVLAGAAGPTLSGILVSYGLAGVVGNVVGGRLSDRFGAAIVLCAALLGAGLSLAVLTWAGGNAVGAGAVFAVWGFCAWAANSPLQTLLLTMSGRFAQVVVALNSAVIALGTAAGSGIGGLLVDGGRTAELGAWSGAAMTVSVALTVVVIVGQRRATLRGRGITRRRRPACHGGR
ncbi:MULTISPECIES: MFS transporter [Curtobacterium]|uniref:MFS transporter n=1 Tax=Curtobacterium TaxID=2034 RepID=UPI00217ECCA9|nr:MFS transporter [Curtobacterium flaccumfaciens]MCS6561247.1 MFS transporter [Curtobacterium flaccumfaciens pv. poinsettiae]UXN29404.1 MFS transporter [Curtobacterium flaccumfaciens]